MFWVRVIFFVSEFESMWRRACDDHVIQSAMTADDFHESEFGNCVYMTDCCL
jgi:hypothetical protein